MNTIVGKLGLWGKTLDPCQTDCEEMSAVSPQPAKYATSLMHMATGVNAEHIVATVLSPGRA
jgi:hypothetical protein